MQIRDLAGDFFQMRLCHGLDLGTAAGGVLIKLQKRPAILNGKAKRAGAAEKRQLVQIAVAKRAIAIRRPQRLHKADFLIIADGLGGQARPRRNLCNIHAKASCAILGPLSAILGVILRNRSAFDTTKTELSAIAPAASIGDSKIPKAGYKAPAATGISATL